MSERGIPREGYTPPPVVYGWIYTSIGWCDDPECGGPHAVVYGFENFRCDACGMTTVYCVPETLAGRGTVERAEHEAHHATFGCRVWAKEMAG